MAKQKFLLSWSLRAYLLLILSCCIVSKSIADDTHKDLACVQKQLQQYAKAYGSISKEPDLDVKSLYSEWRPAINLEFFPSQLTPENAVVVCRLMASEYPRMLGYVPGLKQRFKLHIGTGVDKKLSEQVTQVLIQALANNLKFNGIRLIRTVPVVVGTTYEHLAEFAKQDMATDFNEEVFGEVFTFTCVDRMEVASGFVYGRSIYLCFESDDLVFSTPHLRVVDAEIGERWQRVESLILHELFHIYQRELVGFDAKLDGRPLGDDVVALPTWFIEGTAILAGYRVYNEAFNMETEALEEQLGLMTIPFNELESDLSYDLYGDKVYEQGSLASIWLILEYRRQSIDNFMKYVGAGLPWPVAFKKSFGITPSAFYAQLKNLN